MYIEDVELCHRGRQARYNILNVPSSHVVHLRAGTSLVREDARQLRQLPHYYYASRARYYYLLFGRSGPFLANLFWIAGRAISTLREIIKQRKTHIPEKRWRDIWTNWWDPLQGKPPVKPL